MRRTSFAVFAALATGVAASAAAVAVAGDHGATMRQLAAVKAATAKYHNVEAALADGYVPASPCEASAAGAMGFHYIHPVRMTSPAIVGEQPEILLYVPRPNGKLRLVGVEYWRAAAAGPKPMLFGQPFEGPMAGHAPGMPVHYDLHVWIWAHNPSGMFAQYNPAVSC